LLALQEMLYNADTTGQSAQNEGSAALAWLQDGLLHCVPQAVPSVLVWAAFY
jgi:hypothetical protein